jgi:hypothetical protein
MVAQVVAEIAPELADPAEGWVDPDRPQYVYERKGTEMKIYGGLMCENIVQALARIVVMGQMLGISRKHRVVMTTHDEVATVVRKAQGQRASDFMQTIMMTPPAWCDDLPLNADGAFDVFYAK